MDNNPMFESRIDLTGVQKTFNAIQQEINAVIVGQDKLVEQIIIAMLCEGHILLEGLPGVAKTLMAKCVAKTVDTEFTRIQFTPDLMPSDVIGTMIYNMKSNEFELKKGPIFSNIILIDEINRSPAKTQSALFECMEEQQVTIDGLKHKLESPFLVIGTQNPIDHEGTYRLPEAQQDRFLFKLFIEYPELEAEIEILNRHQTNKHNPDIYKIKAVLNRERLEELKKTIASVVVKDDIVKYIAELVGATRANPSIYIGASPRASINLLKSAKTLAAINGRDFVIPEDVKEMVYPVLNHRVILSPEKEMEGQTIKEVLRNIVEKVTVPR